MKNFKVVYFILCLVFTSITAQESKEIVHVQHLPKILLAEGVSLHFISPEPIQFVDISTEDIMGDLPTEQIARVKIVQETVNNTSFYKDSISVKPKKKKEFKTGDEIGIVTVVGQSFMAQYKIIYKGGSLNGAVSNIQIQPNDMQPLEFPKMKLSSYELKQYCYNILTNKNEGKPLRKERDFKMQFALNNVYVVGDYIFLDLEINNKTNLSYNIEDIKFTVDDKKIYKATNSQSITMTPIYKFNKQKSFKKNYRNIFVFKKFTFPNSKILKIRLIEEQMSGRTLEIKVKYSDILNADSI